MKDNILLSDNLQLAGMNPEDITIQTYTDAKHGKGYDPLASIFAYDSDTVKKYMDGGAYVGWCINPQEKKNLRSKLNTKKFLVFNLDLDAAKEKEKTSKEEIAKRKKDILNQIRSLPIQPTGIIESKNGFQPYWIFKNGLELKTKDERLNAGKLYLSIRNTFSKLISYPNEGDSLCRVSRLPGTLHQKDPEDTFLITEIPGTGELVDYNNFLKEYLPEPTILTLPDNKDFKLVRDKESVYDCPVKDALEKLSGSVLVNGEVYDFKQNSNGTLQILINGEAHSCWVDLSSNTIGARAGESPVNIVNWVKFYNPGMTEKEIREKLDEILLPEKKTTSAAEVKEDSGFDFVTLDKIYEMKFSPERWLIDKILLETGFNLWVGEGGCGKSYLVLAMAKSIITGGKFLDKFVVNKSVPILFLDKENGLRRFQQRLKGLGCPSSNLIHWLKYPERFSLENEDHIEKIRNYILQNKIGLVVVDSYVDVVVGSENSAEDTSDTFEFLRKISDEISWIVIHHSSKPSGMFTRTIKQKTRGSGNIINQSDSGFYMEEEKDGLYTIEQSKARDGKPMKKFEIEFISSRDFEDVANIIYKGEVEEELKNLEMVRSAIFKSLGNKSQALTIKDLMLIEDIQGTSEKTIRRAIKVLEDEKYVEFYPGTRGEKYYFKK